MVGSLGELSSTSLPAGTYRRDLPFYLGEHLLALGDGLVDRADIEERLFGIFVHLTAQNHLEAADCLAQGHHDAGKTGELLGHEEGLREETLGAAGAGHHEFVFVRKLVDTEDGDDILQLIVLSGGAA